jgi:hypothetical protein
VALGEADLLDRLAAACNDDGEFGLAARFWTGALRLELGDTRGDLVLDEGRVSAVVQCAGDTPDEPGWVCVSAPESVWAQVLAPVPAPYFNDILPARAAGLEIEGHTETFWQYYPAVRRAVDLLRAERHRTAVP